MFAEKYKRMFFERISNWYFNRRALPYGVILLVDTLIVLMSTLVVFWVFNRTDMMIKLRFEVLYSALIYSGLSVIGALAFKTCSGIFRYSSFADLLRVAYANGLSLFLALLVSWGAELLSFKALSALNQTQTVITFLVSTLAMSGVRVIVKTLYDVTIADKRAYRTLIYGALTGGIGIAKSIRSQNPRQFVLCGFISHDSQTKHIRLMGEKVYSVEDDLKAVIEKERIEAVLVSPLKVDDFRNNQAIQDVLIRAGVKIFMAQQAKEAIVKDGELTVDSSPNMQLKEVSVEDLLPRSEIKVDMDSVGRMLTDKRVMITGSAGSIGSEIVRQIAVYKPAMMVLIDQAETPQHDVQLMMDKDYPA